VRVTAGKETQDKGIIPATTKSPVGPIATFAEDGINSSENWVTDQ
jgi:hypothetical protein